ncbi:MAG TPA: MYXO-CTERM sorting domain-containing protein, partial [Kofleriaceae bacterium]
IVKDATEPAEVGRDMKNVIKFRDDSWCRPKIGNDAAHCYENTAAAGLTTATYVDDAHSDRDGAIVDADIELNGAYFAISDDGNTLGDRSNSLSDLRNTLTHEMGHLLGLEHTCLASGDPPRIDGNGNDVPLCGLTSDPAITEATMYPFQDPGETKKRSLEADDIAGICTVYPTADDPGTCSKPGEGGGCCSASTDGPSGAVLLFGAVGLLGVTRPRRRRR